MKKTPLREARQLFLAGIDPERLESEILPVNRALNRITAEPIFAKISSPHYHGSAMDGICARAEDTFRATEFNPVRLKLLSGEPAPHGCFAFIDTGHALPLWANAVIMIEKVRQVDERTVEIFESTAPWQNVRLVGEDVVATELLLPRAHRLRPYDLGALLAAGHTQVAVKARPRVAIIPTGDEIVQPGADIEPGRIIDFNSTVIAALVEEAGGSPTVLPAVSDNPVRLKMALDDALQEHHMIAIIAGSSAGEHDFTAQVIEEAGQLLVHGIDIMPGKPAILGVVQGKPVVGVPGYPVSAIVIVREIIETALAKFLGQGFVSRNRVAALVPKKIASHLGVEELIRVTLGRVEGKLVAVPLRRGAGVITTMVQADGLLRIPSLTEGINAGEAVDIELLRSVDEIERTILCTGSHDLSIDILGDQLKRNFPGSRIAASNVGSFGGLSAVQRGETHMAGTHLLDPATGHYNIPDIQRTIPDTPLVLVRLVRRMQGLLVRPGNPRKITDLRDLTRGDVAFVNRQPGSGTRVLLDYELQRRQLDARLIRGYGLEEFTHMAVSVAIASGLADVGLGVQSAANALGLEFIAVGEEQYDLLIRRSFFESASGAELLQVIHSAAFRKAVEALGGYDASCAGEIAYQQ